MSNYQIFSKNFKTGLRFEEFVPWTLSKHDFVQILRYWEDVKDIQKNVWRLRQNNFWQQNIKFQNIWDYLFYWNSSDKVKGIQVKTCITLIIPENLKILVSRYLNEKWCGLFDIFNFLLNIIPNILNELNSNLTVQILGCIRCTNLWYVLCLYLGVAPD